jgi:cyclophilin family peptidyl-prolyl cis-trans isomerase
VFVKDSELGRPVKALHWYNPYITVAIDKKAAEPTTHAGGPDCLGMSDGANAPNATKGSDFFDEAGRRLSGHWEVPTGTHTFKSPIVEERDPGFAARKRRVHAVWTHVHPLCTRASLVQCSGKNRRPIFTTTTRSRTKPGLEIEHIDSIMTSKGIDLPAKHAYELEATYDNTTGQPQDSMVALGIFCADEKFVRPRWVLTGEIDDLECAESGKGNGLFCGITNMYQRLSESTGRAYPLFNPKSDGPLLAEPKTFELLTSAGKIHLVVDPRLAPRHATQIYRLLKNHIFDGTPVSRYEPDYLIQLDIAETKADGKPALNRNQLKLLRRLPLEVSAQRRGVTSHERGVLSMARWDDLNSAVSSFSILLDQAPHLDNEYTIFGHVLDDAETKETLDRIASGWPGKKPVIISASETPALAAR